MHFGRIEKWLSESRWRAPLVVGNASVISLMAVLWMFLAVANPPLYDGYLLQSWSSDDMMQTIPIAVLAEEGLAGLWFNHIYPPLFDGIRLTLVAPDVVFGQGVNSQLVDQRLYLLNLLFYGVINAIIYLWVRDLTGNGWWSLATTLAWAVSPGYLLSMQLLETTPLALTLTTLMFYLLFLFLRTRRNGYLSAFLVTLLLLSLTRNTLQIYGFILVLVTIAIGWIIARPRRPFFFLANCLLLFLMMALPLKQSLLFGSFDVSSFSGYHRVGMLGLDPTSVTPQQLPSYVVQNGSRIQIQFNNLEQLRDNISLTSAANRRILNDPVASARGLVSSLEITVPEILKPSSSYVQDNLFIIALPYRAAYDWLDSNWRLILIATVPQVVFLVLLGFSAWLNMLRRYWLFPCFYALVALPVVWSNRYWPGSESLGPIWTDASRLKLLLMPPLLVFTSYVMWLVVGRIARKFTLSTDEGKVGTSK